MKLIIIKTNLKEGLSIIERAGAENQNLPILKNFLLEVTENKIRATATNLEIAASATIAGKIIEEGRVSVPIGVFSSLLNNLQSERLNLEKKGDSLNIKTDNYEATIQGIPADEFPIIPKLKNPTGHIGIKTEFFKEALGQVLLAAQFSDLRPELNSVFFDYSLDALRLVATDSSRLAEKTIQKNQIEADETPGFKFLLPLKTSQELLRILKDGETLKIYHDEHQALFKTGNAELISRLVDGNFPDYATIIPKKFDAEIVLDREEFLNALKLAGVFGSRVSEVRIKTHENKKALEVSSVDQTLGENRYMLPSKNQGGIKGMSFNWRFLVDGLKAIKTKEVYFGVSEENKPAIVKSPADNSYFYILMPILKP